MKHSSIPNSKKYEYGLWMVFEDESKNWKEPIITRPFKEWSAEKLGFKLVGHRMELYGIPIKKTINEENKRKNTRTNLPKIF